MATEKLQIILDASWRGGSAIRAAGVDLDKADAAAVRAAASMQKGLAIGAGVAGAALAGLAVGARATWQAMEAGADLSRSRDQFERLAESINSTGDAMLGKLKAATAGLMNDAELIANAGQIMSLGLAKTEDAVVRLATVSGKLGWDMSQVILTMANDSVMRLDALGLSIDAVNEKQQRLIKEGFSAGEAFDLAVIEAGEDKILLVGDAADSTAGKMKAFQSAIEDAQNAFNEGLALGVASGIDQIGASAIESADGVAYLTGKLGELWGTYIGTVGASVAAYANTQQILDDAIKLGMITPDYATQLGNQQIGVLRDPSMFGGDRATAIRNAEGVIANLGTQVGQITSQRDLLDANTWDKWAEETEKALAGVGTETEKAGVKTQRFLGDVEMLVDGVESWRTVGAGMNETTRGAAEVADEAGGSMRGYTSAINDAVDAMSQLSAASGDLFSRLRGAKEFNLAEELFGMGDKMGWGATDMASFGVTAGLFDQGRANELMNQSYLLQAAEQMMASGMKGEELWGAIQALQGKLAEGGGLAAELFATIDETSAEAQLLLDTSAGYGELDAFVLAVEEANPMMNIGVNFPGDTGGSTYNGEPYSGGGGIPGVPSTGGPVNQQPQGAGNVTINAYNERTAALAMTMLAQMRRNGGTA
jgi:hypothetical protein